MVEVNFGHRRPERRGRRSAGVAELRAVARRRRPARALGAGVTYTELLAAAVGRPAARRWRRPPAPSARRRSATPARIGGNLGTASPAGDTLPVLVGARRRRSRWRAAGGRAGVPSPSSASARSAPRSARRAGRGGRACRCSTGRQEFLKVGVRNAMVIAVACAGARRRPSTGARCGVALGSVGPTSLGARGARRGWPSALDWATRRDDATADEFGRPGRGRGPARSTTTARPPPTAATPSACSPARALRRALPA